MIPRWVDDYSGIPFAETGSSKAGCNCWGLCALVFKDRTGIELDARHDVASDELIRVVKAINRGARDYIKVEEADAKQLDFLLMRSFAATGGKVHRVADHVGILVSPTHVLHIERGIRSACLPLKHFSIAPRKVSFHRHVSQA